LKITRVRTAVIDGNFPWVLVRVETDAGVTGLGEAYWGAGVAELAHRAGELLLGEDPTNIGKLLFVMERCLSGEGAQAGATVTAISGIEIALWDLLGRAHGLPISTFFGGRFRDKVRIYADCHAGETPDPASYAEKAKSIVAEGFTALKFDLDTPNPHTFDVSEDPHARRQWVEPYSRVIGAAELRWMVAVVEAVRAAVGPDVMVAMDAHWKFNVNDAIKLARALEPFDLVWLEDPVPPINIEAQRAVTQATRTPICTGENLYRLEGFRELIEKTGGAHHCARYSQDGRLDGIQEGRRSRELLLHPDGAAQCRESDRHSGGRASERGDSQFPGDGISRPRRRLVERSGRGWAADREWFYRFE
jgi:L-alanine-DL-glutamate epimerase-like enolase superfamily enzyme